MVYKLSEDNFNQGNKFREYIFYSIITGVISGFILFFFRYSSNFLMELSKDLYNFFSLNINYAPLFFILLFVLSILMYFNIKNVRESSGGGISRSMALIGGSINFHDNLKIIIATTLGSFLSFFGGLSLGAEGPSVFLGTLIGNEIFNKLNIFNSHLKKVILTVGSAGGFVSALGTPLSAILFSIEENHTISIIDLKNKHTFYLIISIIIGGLSAACIVYLLCYLFNINFILLDVSGNINLNLNYIYIPIIIGVFIGFLSLIYNLIIKNFLIFFLKLKSNNYLSFLLITLAFTLSGFIGLLFIDTSGSGIDIIFHIFEFKYFLYALIFILIIKIFLIGFSTATGSTGGLFLPMLVVGALIGGIIAEFLIIGGLNNSYYGTIVIISMITFMASSVKTPITAFIFCFEISGSFSTSLFSILAIVISLIISNYFNGESLNESILDISLERHNLNKESISNQKYI
ncbi:H(+)/Cl(-) exchange transporter ClcA [bioreactor metagenome]|uniref:H(+)/Cl(-) exchange transporter ClcA n=1 Tax=bioreactor metagenome TaxID=1076179 RepID=A0A644TYL4_9ZZZZ